MIIGICDDEKFARMSVRKLCEEYFNQNEIENSYIEFESGEDVLSYSMQADSEQIDLLFLDIEMKEMNGICLMEQLLSQNAIWRIAFVTGYKDKVFDAFGQKTIGFILKPPSYEQVVKMLGIVQREKQENAELEFKGYNGELHCVRLEQIAYLRAERSYTGIYLYAQGEEETVHFVVSKKIGELERSLCSYPVLRVHKSYLINLANVVNVGEEISLRNTDEKIPIGRKYKEQVRTAYAAYIRDKVRKRI